MPVITDEVEPLSEPLEEQTTFHTILCSDVCSVIADHMVDLADLAALWCCTLPAEVPAALHSAVIARATQIVSEQAPLWIAASSFEKTACWPITVAACDWIPRRFFAELRAPAFCRVTGFGRCSHGLCQKQETPKPGVMELLECLASAGSAKEPAPDIAWLSVECIAWLCGALGRKEQALRAWTRAAAAGSPRAQFDVGIDHVVRHDATGL